LLGGANLMLAAGGLRNTEIAAEPLVVELAKRHAVTLGERPGRDVERP
jgi:hypothetical protein